eukprot:CAMPEP_0178956310 /NCGR_PEP_ID=MMETSP0789-20121207/10162_1 /TAXON_ID=3005 /ORGANISM="Rhizosolenia setigera, Strain CCMP 1694" /LENGTH=399 /DNA_ID=CAMNT_0020638183 /DNA_START=575 /DNA_END=1774 /DNA_ORIENTATION=-
MYNSTLSLYYMLKVKYNITERQLGRIEYAMHLFPLLFGFVTATTSLFLELYNPANWDCWISPYPQDCVESYRYTGEGEVCERGKNASLYRWAFFYGPLWTSISFAAICMILVTTAVYRQERKSKRWLMTKSTKSKSPQSEKTIHLRCSQEVATQAKLYIASFYLTWTFPTVVRILQLASKDPPEKLKILAGCFIPIQGFLNAIVYFRPRYKRCVKKNPDKSFFWFLRQIFILSLCCFIDKDINDLYENDGMDIEGYFASELRRRSSGITKRISFTLSRRFSNNNNPRNITTEEANNCSANASDSVEKSKKISQSSASSGALFKDANYAKNKSSHSSSKESIKCFSSNIEIKTGGSEAEGWVEADLNSINLEALKEIQVAFEDEDMSQDDIYESDGKLDS